jgi:hypothetical protein
MNKESRYEQNGKIVFVCLVVCLAIALLGALHLGGV